jgi:peptide/nickel transport system permease protein
MSTDKNNYWIRATGFLGRTAQMAAGFSPMGKVALAVFGVMLLLAVFSSGLAAHSYRVPSGDALAAPGGTHWLGTDDLGIDIWAQICHGAQMSIGVGLATALLAGGGGMIIGLLAGYCGGVVDKILMRLTDMLIVLPDLPVLILMGALLGPSIHNIILALILFSWTGTARMTRSKVISLKQEKYIIAAQSYGAGFWHLASTHFFPELLPLTMVSMIRLAGMAIVAEAGLAFLGLGDPTSKTWGLILNRALGFSGIYFTQYWKWWLTAPLIAITLLVLAIALIGRELEKILNSKL